MASASSRAPQVVIAGGGVAAAATAIRLRALDLRAHLLVRDLPTVPGIEALPRRTLHSFQILGMPGLVADVGGVNVPGPVHQWHGVPARVPSPSIHVDRTVLAASLLAQAVQRGATVETVRRLPPVDDVAPDVLAVVDGTGRAAAWSRPTRTNGHAVAWQFRAPATDDMAGRIVRDRAWWAYRLGHPSTMWMGIVTDDAALDEATVEEAAARLGLSRRSLAAEGRRPAWVQRAVHPVAGRRVAVGDAALAHHPLAGQGIRFALGSAIAAATTIATWAEDRSKWELASTYYRDLVEAEHSRHRAALDELRNADPAAVQPERESSAPAVVRFAGEFVETALAVAGRVQQGAAVRLPTGRTTRWVGDFDLLELARITVAPTPRLLVVTRLQQLGLDAPAAKALVRWAVDNGVLAAASLRGENT